MMINITITMMIVTMMMTMLLMIVLLMVMMMIVMEAYETDTSGRPLTAADRSDEDVLKCKKRETANSGRPLTNNKFIHQTYFD